MTGLKFLSLKDDKEDNVVWLRNGVIAGDQYAVFFASSSVALLTGLPSLRWNVTDFVADTNYLSHVRLTTDSVWRF